MKRVIRRGVFETNSSSSHSLMLGKRDKGVFLNNAGIEPDENGVLVVMLKEYGWGEDFLTTPMEKLEYLVTSLYGYGEDMDKVEYHLLPILKELYGVEEIQIESDGVFGIDHESIGVIENLLLKDFLLDKELVMRYLQDNNVMVHIFGDGMDMSEDQYRNILSEFSPDGKDDYFECEEVW